MENVLSYVPSALHEACLYGRLAVIQLQLASGQSSINSRGFHGHQPVHMVLTPRNSPDTFSCLRYLLENGADVHATTDGGQTPLHLAASEGLLDCTELLVQAGGDVMAQDNMGHTPLDLARIWCHRNVARFLKSCMWQEKKKQETVERKQVQVLYANLLDEAKKKGLTVPKGLSPHAVASRYHAHCLSSDPNLLRAGGPQETNATSTKQPWSIYMGLQTENTAQDPDLRSILTVWRDDSVELPQYTTKWDSTPRDAPDVPLDVLERVLFPRDFPSRITSPQQFKSKDILEVPHRGRPQRGSSSPWTEVAMHLAEVLEPGHY
ncbi:ankyrin repeat domain-containing protein 53 [Aulostomus maculatus]